MIVLPVLFFAIVGVAVWYVASRMAWLTDVRTVWYAVGYGIALLLSLTAMGTYAARFTAGPVMHPLIVLFCHLCAVLLILLLSFLAVDLVHLVLPFGKKVFGLCVLALTVGARYMAEAGADLFLAGHTHGGQFFPLTLINDRAFEYNRGLYRCGDMAVYVSCGSGTFGLPIRIGTDSEITLLHLKPLSSN